MEIVKDSLLETVCFDHESAFKEIRVNRAMLSMKKACPVLAQCVAFISTKKYFLACLQAVCSETWDALVPVLASAECQDSSPHLRPRLMILNVTGTPWQVTSSFMPITPWWFHYEEAQVPPSLLPPRDRHKGGHAIVLRCLPYSWDFREPQVSCASFVADSDLEQEIGPSVTHQATEQLPLIPKDFREIPRSHNEEFTNQDSREK